MHYRWDGNKLYLDCVIVPKSSEDRVAGLLGDALKIKITAPPTDGKANRHLIKYLSKQFQVQQSAITIVSGLGGRQKRLCIFMPTTLPDLFKIEATSSEQSHRHTASSP